MAFSHDTLVWFSKSFGLFYLIGLSIAVLIYVYWPSNKKTFDHAANSILPDEDEPCR
jgi:cytochrome c oxidase cbb3-type subunit IV